LSLESAGVERSGVECEFDPSPNRRRIAHQAHAGRKILRGDTE